MPRASLIPLALTTAPFTLDDARRAGLSRWHLQTSAFRRLGPKLYAWSELGDSPSVRLASVRLRLPSSAAFSGLTAAWLHGLDVEPCDPIEVVISATEGISARAGIRLHRFSLAERQVTKQRGFRVTTIERTLADLCLDLDLAEVVVLSDSAAHSGLTTIKKLAAHADRASGRPGITMFRRVVEYTEPKAESPMESRLRMLLVLANLPRPVAQVSLHDRNGRFIGRPDLFYPEQKLGIEYDGGIHKSNLVDDNRRQNTLLAEGYRLLRFTASDVYNRRESVVNQVRIMLNGAS
jgi:hypothetical protein